uniref:Solute carrier family 12 member 9 n=1 Tax=Plectus sambesii TaxID=2011161 RepID=A0A914VGR1_9BILA
MDEEPKVQIRAPRASTSYGGITEPPTGILIGDLSAPGTSINSTNGDGPPNGAPVVGKRKLDKTPLLTNDQFGRSTSMMSSNDTQHQPAGIQSVMRVDGMSTFSGVMAPVALSMFSVLLFLRMGFVVGQSGVLITLIQLTMAYCIVMLTVFSLCAISTNGAIEGGGVYYMISRALGPEFGGSIGVLFFLANIFSCSLQVSGFVEVLLNNFGEGGSMLSSDSGGLPTGAGFKFIYGVVVLFVLLLVCLIGAKLFAKTSLVMLAIVAVCYCTFLVSIIFKGEQDIDIPKTNTGRWQYTLNETTFTYTGNVTERYTGFSFNTLGENMLSNYTHDYTTEKTTSFALVFAVIFSGITGIMAGANMSGELKQPDVSIPRGTLQAVLTTYGVYLLTAVLLGASCSGRLLRNDYTVLLDINVWPPFILIAIFATTLFSSMSNLLGASRVLTRVGEDRLFGFLLKPATVYFGDRNPVFSVIIGWVLAVLVLLIGALNRIAQITSILFLLSYMGVNLACLALEMASAPNFRPTFKFFSWHTAALGFAGCVAMMLLIDAATSAIAIILLMLLIIILHYMAPMGSWGSISQALIYHQVRKYLLLLDSRKDHVKYWRPQILLLVKRPATSCPLMDFVNDLKKSGLYVIGHVKKGHMDDYQIDPLHDVYPYWLSLIDYLK